MRVNTELVGEKVPENKSLPAFFSIYLRARYFVYMYSKPNQIRIHDDLFYSFLCRVD